MTRYKVEWAAVLVESDGGPIDAAMDESEMTQAVVTDLETGERWHVDLGGSMPTQDLLP